MIFAEWSWIYRYRSIFMLKYIKVSCEWMHLPSSPRWCIALASRFEWRACQIRLFVYGAAGQRRWEKRREYWWSEWPTHSPPAWGRRVSSGQTEKQQEEKKVESQTSHSSQPFSSPSSPLQLSMRDCAHLFAWIVLDLVVLIVPVIRFSRGLNPISSVFQHPHHLHHGRLYHGWWYFWRRERCWKLRLCPRTCAGMLARFVLGRDWYWFSVVT